MPDDPNYSVEEDQANPVDLSGLGMSPVQPTPSPVQPPPAPPSPGDQLTQRILAQLNTSPESIYQDKVKEYYHDLGVTPGTKKAKIASFLNELTKNYQSTGQHLQQDRENGWYTAPNNPKAEPYKPLNQRIRDSAQSEYEKTYALQKGEAETLGRDLRTEERSKAQEKVAQIRADELKRQTESKERIEFGKQKLKGLKDQADIGDLNAKALYTSEKTRELKMTVDALEKRDPLFKLESPEVKNILAAKELGIDPKDIAEMSNAVKPTVQGSMNIKNDKDWSQYLSRTQDIEAAKKLGKYPPGAGNPSRGVQIVQGQAYDPKTGEPIVTWGTINKNDPNPAFKPLGTNQQTPGQDPTATTQYGPLDAKKRTKLESLSASEAQAMGTHGTVASMMQNGTDGELTGPLGGNTLSKLAREYDVNGSSPPSERMKDIMASNTARMHTQSMSGAGRYAEQAAQEFRRNLATEGMAGPKTLMNAMGALVYTNQIARLEGAHLLKPGEMDNILMARVNNEILKATQTASSDKEWNAAHPGQPKRISRIVLKPFSEILNEHRNSLESKPKVDPAKGTKSSVAQKYGID